MSGQTSHSERETGGAEGQNSGSAVQASRRPRLLILSFSPIVSDARVLKQVRLFTPTHEVTTCGYGDAPEGVAHHLRIPEHLLSWRLNRPLVVARRFAAAQQRQEAVAWLRTQLVPGSYDVVLADDVETVPLALWLRPAGGVHADLHEYFPRQKENVWRWRLFVAPYVRWMCRTFLPQAASVTTVAQGLAEAYERECGVPTGVVTNAAPYREGEPTGVGRPLRLVHSGAALAERHLEVMVEAMGLVRREATLDLYLTRNDAALIDSLRQQAAALPAGRVRVMDPVPYAELVETLAGYDVGVFNLPPTSFSYLHALPNKLFDFIQARLATVVSPNPEMARLVRDYGLGVVTAGYEATDLAAAIDDLSEEQVAGFKQAAHRAARLLCAQKQVGGWWQAVLAADRRAAACDPTIALPQEDQPSPDAQGDAS